MTYTAETLDQDYIDWLATNPPIHEAIRVFKEYREATKSFFDNLPDNLDNLLTA